MIAAVQGDVRSIDPSHRMDSEGSCMADDDAGIVYSCCVARLNERIAQVGEP